MDITFEKRKALQQRLHAKQAISHVKKLNELPLQKHTRLDLQHSQNDKIHKEERRT